MWHDKVLTLLLWATQSTFCMDRKFFFTAHFKILILKMGARGLVEWAFQKHHGIFDSFESFHQGFSVMPQLSFLLYMWPYTLQKSCHTIEVLPGKPFEMTWQFSVKYHNCSVLHRSHGIISTWQLKCYLGNSVFDFLLYCRIL